MSLLQFKKKRNHSSGKFSYVLKNSIVFSRVRNKWFLRLPKEILRVMKLHTGSKVDLSTEGKLLIIATKNISRKFSARRKIRARLKVQFPSKR